MWESFRLYFPFYFSLSVRKGGLCSHIMAANEIEEAEALTSDAAGGEDVFEGRAEKRSSFISTLGAQANSRLTPNSTSFNHSSSHLPLITSSVFFCPPYSGDSHFSTWAREKSYNRHLASKTFLFQPRDKLKWILKLLIVFFFVFFRLCLWNPSLCVMELQIKELDKNQAVCSWSFETSLHFLLARQGTQKTDWFCTESSLKPNSNFLLGPQTAYAFFPPASPLR